jgi:hypothetical protein
MGYRICIPLLKETIKFMIRYRFLSFNTQKSKATAIALLFCVLYFYDTGSRKVLPYNFYYTCKILDFSLKTKNIL